MSDNFNGVLELIIFSDNFKEYSRAFKDLELPFQPCEDMTLNIVTSEYKIAKISWDTKTLKPKPKDYCVDVEITHYRLKYLLSFLDNAGSLKPSNTMLSIKTTGRVIISLDFNISLAFKSSSTSKFK